MPDDTTPQTSAGNGSTGDHDARKKWLPSEASEGHGPGRTLLSLGVMLVALVIANFGAGWIVRATETSHAVINTKWSIVDRGAEDASAPAPWLVLGDSSGNQGVDTEVLESALGAPAYNLCTVGNMLTLDSAWMLDRWLDEHGPVAGVLLIHAYDTWDREARGSVFGLIPASEFPSDPVPPLELEWRERATMTMVQRAPLLVLNASMRNVVQRPRETISKLRGGSPFAGIGSMNAQGFLDFEKARPQSVINDVNRHLADIAKRETPPELSVPNRAGLERIASLCQEAGVPLYLVYAPVAETLGTDRAFVEHFARVDAMLRVALDEFGWGEVLFDTPRLFSKDEMQNADHLIGASAERFTGMIAERLGSTAD